MSPSTPGVCLPGFSVTRLTAKALPLHEWVSKCCKAFTLPHLPSWTAFTIRACSRRTIRCTLRQSMACQCRVLWETAPAGVAPAVICLVSSIGFSSSLVTKDQREVCPLSRGVMLQTLNPYPSHYRTAFACSLLLYPPSHGLALRSAFHRGRTTGLPCSASVPEWGRSALSAGSACGHEKRRTTSSTGLLTFWSKPLSAFGLSSITTFIRRSHMLTLPLHPSSGPHWRSQARRLLTVSTLVCRRRLRCPRRFTPLHYPSRMAW